VVNLEELMIVIKAFIKYRCGSCGLDYVIKFSPLPPGDVTKINESIDRTKLCTVCGRAAEIEQIIFRTVENSYGSDMYGSWRCPIHSAFVYYPILMKEAERKRHDTNIAMSEYEHNAGERYKKIIIDGYPWVCPNPGCGKSMVYKDDREDHLYG
jgi:hypothetical protein